MVLKLQTDKAYLGILGTTILFLLCSLHIGCLNNASVENNIEPKVQISHLEESQTVVEIPEPVDADHDEVQTYILEKRTEESQTRRATTVSTSRLTKAGGINYHNGWKETWYSSRVLRHYRIGEWTTDEYGVYRDSEGYVIVASTEPSGSIVETSFGLGKVYDSGCDYGVHDIYTNW